MRLWHLEGGYDLKNTPEVAIFSSQPTLTSDPINPDWILEGTPNARVEVLAVGSDESARTVIWDCSAGKFNWFYNFDETVMILEGSVTLFGGTPKERTLTPGDVVFFPKGSQAHWHVADYVRKLAFCHSLLPKIITKPYAMLRTVLRPSGGTAMG